MKSLSQILNDILTRDKHSEDTCEKAFSKALFDIRLCKSSDLIFEFTTDERAINKTLAEIENRLRNECPNYSRLSQTISYLLDELTCNIQQHACVESEFIYFYDYIS